MNKNFYILEAILQKDESILKEDFGLGVLTAVGAITIYNSFLSKHTKVCSYLRPTGKEKDKAKAAMKWDICKAKVKNGGVKEVLKVLAQGKSKCNKTKDPKKCKEKIDKQITHWKKKSA